MNQGSERKETAGMVQIECPWCSGAAALVAARATDADEAVECADCGVRVEFAADAAAWGLARAA